MPDIIILLVLLRFESLHKMKLATPNITWLLSCSMALSIGSQWLLHEPVDMKQFIIYNLFGSKKELYLTVCGMVVYASAYP